MKVAVAGLGWWGKQIVKRLKNSSRFEVLYGVDPLPSADISNFVAQYHFGLETDLSAVLRDEAVESVILATPHALHEEQIIAAVAAGKNVFCEKPLTMTADGARRALEACNKAGKILGVGHERRWEPAIEELARLIQSGSLGRIQHMDANVSHNQFLRLASSNWRLDPAHAPAGMMTAVGIHLTDLFVNFAGPTNEVRAQTARMILPPPAEDFVTANIVFKSGTRATVTALSATPFYSRFAVFGDRGWAEVTNEANVDQNKPATLTYSDGIKRTSTVFEAVDTIALNFEHWAEAVQNGAPYRFTADELIENIRLFEAIVASSRQNGAVIAL
jgi:predicted dehydrogenase